jgi:hypothetical protein
MSTDDRYEIKISFADDEDQHEIMDMYREDVVADTIIGISQLKDGGMDHTSVFVECVDVEEVIWRLQQNGREAHMVEEHFNPEHLKRIAASKELDEYYSALDSAL